MSPFAILKKALRLIEDPRNWTRDTMARNKNGRARDVHHPKAVCFCTEGAVRKVTGESSPLSRNSPADRALQILDQAAQALGFPKGAWQLNDQGTHALVIRMFEKAKAATRPKH